ncbi:hypothetical protein [Nitratireductor pacificus]|uniref:Uncharacterized protein n=1 Tax=Nitratireductor pacificus pht-3B TaxID=391937 RepID=K2MIF4_9HYPH|nr:hypothetical protein [Nitratireductor pacificus]EKF20490.1 hypothetical protein NA2_01859 [Nitratireductor pacificus pht-3B]
MQKQDAQSSTTVWNVLKGAVSLGVLFLTVQPGVTSEVQDGETAVLSQVLSATSIDLIDEHSGAERVVLMTGTNPDASTADLAITTGVPHRGTEKIVLIVRDIAFAGPMSGQIPYLERAPNGSLLIQSMQTAVGRSPWEETLTLAKRDGAIVVAGFTRNSWDRISATGSSCDWNLLSGNWELSYQVPVEGSDEVRSVRKSGRKEERIQIADWPERSASLTAFCSPEE